MKKIPPWPQPAPEGLRKVIRRKKKHTQRSYLASSTFGGWFVRRLVTTGAGSGRRRDFGGLRSFYLYDGIQSCRVNFLAKRTGSADALLCPFADFETFEDISFLPICGTQAKSRLQTVESKFEWERGTLFSFSYWAENPHTLFIHKTNTNTQVQSSR